MQPVKKIVKTPADLSPNPVLGFIKTFVSPKSTAGLLRDQGATVDKKVKQAGG
jgi:hypothetical protein